MKKNITFLFLLLANNFAFSQWSTSSTVNNPICVTAPRQGAPRAVSDGNGGAIITWWELDLTTSDNNIYAQRIDAGGVVQWTVNGIAICTNPDLQHVPEIISDEVGGAIITWFDRRNGNADIYAQRINGSGAVLWAVDGVPVCLANNDQTSPQLTSDGSSGAIVTWRDLRGSTGYVPYAQKLNANGIAQWVGDGILLSGRLAEGSQIISDGSGGAIIAWHSAFGSPTQFDIYAQQINTNGILGWGINGLSLCILPSNQFFPQLISDGANGAIVVWEDQRSGSYYNLFAQKVNAGGAIQWALNGVPVAPNTLNQRSHKLLSDGIGGVFITWEHYVGLVYAQRVNSSGVPQWGADAVSISSVNSSRLPQIVTDGGTGAIITWYDFRGSSYNIFAQRINSSGAIQWITNGVNVCTASNDQTFPRLVENGSGGAIITWVDPRNDLNSSDIFASKVNADGTLGGAIVGDLDGDGYTVAQGDCNDNNAAIHPFATEVCNTVDDDCDGLIDESVQITFYRDVDTDGYGNAAVTIQACSVPAGYVSNSSDCNDASASIHPGAIEVCNGADDDCDGLIDEGVKTTFYRDVDTDGYGNAAVTIQACSVPAGYVSNSTDCNDASASIHPGAIEVCNGADDDCDGLIDEGVKATFYRDVDTDGYGNAAVTIQACSVPAGYVSNSTDCNDASASIHPGATEVCNGADDDCDGLTDEGVQTTYYRDMDTDGYGNAAVTTQACSVPSGYVSNSTDCNDASAAINPGATEICNGVDDDCDGLTDEGCNPAVTLSVADALVYEAGGPALIPVSLSNPSTSIITVKYKTVNGTAKHPKDYTSTSGTLTFLPGETSKNISVPVIADAITEGDEDFLITLSRPTNTTIADGSGTVTITETALLTKANNKGAAELKSGIEIILIVPNPQRRTEHLRIYGIESGSFDIIISDLSGKIVYRQKNYRNNWIPNQLSTGIYLYQLLYKNLAGELKRRTGKLLITE